MTDTDAGNLRQGNFAELKEQGARKPHDKWGGIDG